MDSLASKSRQNNQKRFPAGYFVYIFVFVDKLQTFFGQRNHTPKKRRRKSNVNIRYLKCNRFICNNGQVKVAIEFKENVGKRKEKKSDKRSFRVKRKMANARIDFI